MSRICSLFLAVVLSFGLFTELRITAFPKLENGNDYSWFIFISESEPDRAQMVPENWRCRTLSLDMSSLWSGIWGVNPLKSVAMKIDQNGHMLAWVPQFQNVNCNTIASYDAIFFFVTCLALSFLPGNPVFAMLGVFASVLTSAPGNLLPYLLPWDMPTMAAWTVIFWLYSALKTRPALRMEWLWLGITIAALGLLKETVLVTALFFLGAPWAWPKRIAAIAGTVIASQLINWGLFGARPDWLFSVSNANAGGHRWNPLLLWPILLANAGSIAFIPLLLWKRRDWPLAAVCGAFIVLQCLNNLACGVYNENRDWLELAPLGWLLIGQFNAPLIPAKCPSK